MIEAILNSQRARYPAMQIEDLYKLLHQGALGSEHAVSDRRAAEQWLARELAEMGEGPPEPMIDPISAEGALVRVHLRPFLAAGNPPEELLAAFLETANGYRGSPRALEAAWRIASASAWFPAAAMDGFLGPLRSQGFPAVHHSPAYEAAYRPAYRVVALAYCPRTWRGLNP